MTDLVATFLDGIQRQRRTLSCDADKLPTYTRLLVTMLLERFPLEQHQMVLKLLADVRDADEFCVARGLDAVFHVVLQYGAKLGKEADEAVSRILTTVDSALLVEALVRNDLERIVPALIYLHLSWSDLLINLVSLLDTVLDSARALRAVIATEVYSHLLSHVDLLVRDPGLTVVALNVLRRLACIDHSTATAFWTCGGARVLSVVRDSPHSETLGAGVFLQTLADFARLQPEVMEARFDEHGLVDDNFVYAVNAGMLCGAHGVYRANVLLGIPAVRKPLGAHVLFCDQFAGRIALECDRLSDQTLLTALRHLTAFSAHTTMTVVEDLVHVLRERASDTSEVDVALCLLILHQTSNPRLVVEHFRFMMNVADVLTATPSRSRHGRQGAAEEDVGDLDHLLTLRFDALVEDPSPLLRGFELVGTSSRDVVFHLLPALLGDLPLPQRTSVASRVTHYVRESVLSDASHMSSGKARYVSDIAERYGIDLTDAQLPSPIARHVVARCPVTLEAMHFPVVASDGNTYELLTMLALPQRQSPLTRTHLDPVLTYNRALVDMEAAIAEQRPVRRRRRIADTTTDTEAGSETTTAPTTDGEEEEEYAEVQEDAEQAAASSE